MQPFKNAVIVGRFQHIHIGHEKLINIALKVASRVLVLVGSSDKCGTDRNPYHAVYRIDLIEKVYKKEIKEGRVIVKPLPDLTNENDLSEQWGKYVVSQAEYYLGEKLECIVYGKDKNIFKCFSKEVVDNISEIFVDRKQLMISATMLREMLAENNKEEWKKYVSKELYGEYDNLRGILLDINKH